MAYVANQLALNYYGGAGASKRYTYITADTITAVMASGYFNNATNMLNIGDIIDVIVVDAVAISTRTAATGFTTIMVASNDGTTVTTDTIGAVVSGTTTVAADVLAIPVTHRFVTKTTGADAEALTLANGVPGQILTILLGTDGGGDGTLTPTTKTGFSTIVFADAGDQATLEFVDATIGWVIVGYAGLAAPPVVS